MRKQENLRLADVDVSVLSSRTELVPFFRTVG